MTTSVLYKNHPLNVLWHIRIFFRRILQLCDLLFSSRWNSNKSMIDSVVSRYELEDELKFYEEMAYNGFNHTEQEALDKVLPTNRKLRILLMGCGTGRECFPLEELGHQVVGYDASTQMIEIAKRIKSTMKSNVEFTSKNPIEGHEEFDLIFFTWGFLNHIPGKSQRGKLLRDLSCLLTEKGEMLTFMDIMKFKFLDINYISSVILRLRFILSGQQWSRGDTVRSYLGNHCKQNMMVYFHYYQNQKDYIDEVKESGLRTEKISEWGWRIERS